MVLDTKARLSVRFFTFCCQVCEYFLHKTTNTTEYYQQLAIKYYQPREMKHYFCHSQEGTSDESEPPSFLIVFIEEVRFIFILVVWEHHQAICQRTEYCSIITDLSSLIGMLGCYPGHSSSSSRHHIPSLISYLQRGDINLTP